MQAPGGLIFGHGFFALPVWGAYIYLEGLIHGGVFSWNFTVCDVRRRNSEGGWGGE